MNNYQELLEKLESYQALLASFQQGKTPIMLTGLSNIHKSHFIFSACADLKRDAVVVVHDEPTASRLCEDLNVFLGREAAVVYPAREFTFREVDGASREYEHARLNVLENLLHPNPASEEKGPQIVVASAEAALQFTVPPQTLADKTRTLCQGESYPMEDLIAFLVGSGYERTEQVEGVCQFSQRGGILDFFPPYTADPIRIEFWDTEIDTISYFAVDTQRRTDSIDQVAITPAKEVLFDSLPTFLEQLERCQKELRGKGAAKVKENISRDRERLESGVSLNNIDKYLPLIYPEPATLLDYLDQGKKRLFFLCESVSVRENLKNANWQLEEDVRILFEEGILFKGCDVFAGGFPDIALHARCHDTAILDTFVRTLPEIPLRELKDVSCVQLSSWSGEYQLLKEEAESYLRQGYGCVVLAGTERTAAAVAGDLQRDGLPADFLNGRIPLQQGRIYVTEGALSAGMEYPECKLALLTHSRTGASRKKIKPRHKKGEQIRSLADLNFGDPVVHISHGIGIFQGIVKQEIQGVIKDYIKIRYAGTDTLFVPVTQLDLVSKYIGPRDDGSIKLNKLNSTEWNKTKQRVKKAVADMAKELIKLYAERAKAEGFAFGPDTDWQRDFEDRFPYEETDDQLRCIDEIKADMEKPVPMDRLLCGDVGFGKTEVAFRAVFKAVMDSKQCAVLVPTTILAWQHYQTFRRRMEGFPIQVEILSRFRTPKQQQQIIRELARGQIDVIIGTHRILSKDIEFKDLGLCVVDEEQRFGVAHKEKLKELKNNIDVLTLSATPIPRTLNMAMSGIRDMSVIEEAPSDRHPVQTYVVEHDWGIIGEAIKRELRRDGQVFYLHNRIESIESCAAKLAQLVPDARIVTAHGRMGEEALSDVWRRLVDHEIDLLVCTTIIETGVDVSNCNTLIIEDADRMGLSQLYQLRGRVGRSSRRAFAYLTFKRGKELTDIATKRLSAIREFTTFGSGFRIAMRDLEIRGAGNILGSQQHGHMESVGYDMYIRLLSEAVQEEKGEKTETAMSEECLIDMRIGAHIPETYIDSLSSRIDIYKKIAGIRNEEDAMDVTDELIDRFGEPPKAVKGLVDVALVRNTAASLGISEISQREDQVSFFPDKLDFERIGRLSARYRNRVNVEATGRPVIRLRLTKEEQPIDVVREALMCMRVQEKSQ